MVLRFPTSSEATGRGKRAAASVVVGEIQRDASATYVEGPIPDLHEKLNVFLLNGSEDLEGLELVRSE